MSGFPGARRHWRLDPGVAQLNHGGFGATPVGVLQEQQRWRDLMERNPTDFLVRRLPGLLEEARIELAGFLGADPAGLAFVTNATAGIATALAGLELEPGDEVLTTDHRYNAVRVQLDLLAARTGATVVEAEVALPVTGADDVAGAVTAAMTSRTRVLVLDHVTSPTGIVMPVELLAAHCRERGVLTVVDGAQALAMLPLRLDELGVDYWTGNLHKWLCAPKSGAVLWARPEHRDALRPLVASHSHHEGLLPAFDWTGTFDPSPLLSAPAAVELFAKLDWDDVRTHNRELARDGALLVAGALGTSLPVPDEMSGAMRAVPLGRTLDAAAAREVELRLLTGHGIEVPLMPSRAPAYVRVSAQVYNQLDDYRRLAGALPCALAAV
ncbi:MAG: aminotransferase class V-fold PLP-dependent enzyme [Frankiaceae bacterium]